MVFPVLRAVYLTRGNGLKRTQKEPNSAPDKKIDVVFLNNLMSDKSMGKGQKTRSVFVIFDYEGVRTPSPLRSSVR